MRAIAYCTVAATLFLVVYIAGYFALCQGVFDAKILCQRKYPGKPVAIFFAPLGYVESRVRGKAVDLRWDTGSITFDPNPDVLPPP